MLDKHIESVLLSVTGYCSFEVIMVHFGEVLHTIAAVFPASRVSS